MANYTKSFNFRNGVQVDDSNFIVNPVGLVGIGTTIPEKHLDVRGDAKIVGDARITGFTSVTNIEVVGVMTVGAGINLDPGSGIITATKFVGDASGLTNIVAIATGGFIANVGSLHTTAKVGIGSTQPSSLLDVLGNSKFVGVTTFTGITTSSDTLFANSLSVKTLSVEGISTFIGVVTAKGGAYVDNIQIGISDDNEIDTSSGNLTLDSATGQTTIDDNLNVTGIVSAADYKGLSNGAADFPSGLTATTGTFSTRIDTNGVSFGTNATTFAAKFDDDAVANFGTGNDLQMSHANDVSLIRDTRAGVGATLAIGADKLFLRNKDGNENYLEATDNGSVKLFFDFLPKFETISVGASVYNELRVGSLGGGTSGLSSHFGSLRYGSEDPGSDAYSTRTSLDLINTDSGNINYYLNFNSKPTTGDFHWHKGVSTPLMILTGVTGRLGVGTTLPEEKLHVEGGSKITGISTFGSDLYVGDDLFVKDDLEVLGTITGDVTGDVTGNITATSGTSNFNQLLINSGIATISNFQANKLGINTSPIGSNNFLTLPVVPNNEIIIDDVGRIGIRTTSSGIATDVVINASQTSAVFGVVGVGTTRPEAAVDFSAAGISSHPTHFNNRTYMYPPFTSDTATLTGMQQGAMVFDTSVNRLKIYLGGNWQVIFDGANN